MKQRWILSAVFLAGLSLILAAQMLSSSTFAQGSSKEAVKRDLVFFGPAQAGMMRAGFNPTGSITVFPTADELGTDKMKVVVRGLPANTDFTVFLHELADIPFGSSEYIADMHTDNHGDASVTVRTVIMEAFALKTAGNPPTERLIDTDLKFVAIWFADPKDSAPFLPTGFPALAFDGDRSSGAVVLGTTTPLH